METTTHYRQEPWAVYAGDQEQRDSLPDLPLLPTIWSSIADHPADRPTILPGPATSSPAATVVGERGGASAPSPPLIMLQVRVCTLDIDQAGAVAQCDRGSAIAMHDVSPRPVEEVGPLDEEQEPGPNVVRSDHIIRLHVERGTTISVLRALLAERTGLPAERQRLDFAGRLLRDAETVAG